MADNEMLNKWIGALTPRRAIHTFFENASPDDSPNPEDIFEPPAKLVPPEEEVTPVAGSSQSSQRSRIQKRKLVGDEEQSQPENVSKTNDFDDGSVFGTSEFPSRLESPNLVIPPRPSKRNKKTRMSFTAFSNAIRSQQSQVVNTSDDLGELSIPSVLRSPEEGSQRLLRSKKCDSSSKFKEPLGGGKIQNVTALSGLEESGLDSSGIPSNLQSPEFVSSQNRFNPKSRMSTTTFNKILAGAQQEPDSGEIPSSLDSPEKVQQVNRFDSKSKARMSTTAFSKVLDQRNEEEEVLATEVFPDDLEPGLQQTSDFPLKNQSSRISKGNSTLSKINSPSVANVSTLRGKRSSKSSSEETALNLSRSQRMSIAIEPRRSIGSTTKVTEIPLETSPKASGSELSDSSSMPALESEPEKLDDSTEESRNEDRPSDQSHKEKSIGTSSPIPSVSINISTLEIPSQLDSPHEYKQYNRPGPASFKKKVSATAFSAAFSQKNEEIIPSLNSSKGPKQATSKEASVISVTTRPLLVEKDMLTTSSRSSSRASNKSSASNSSNRRIIPSSESVISAINKSLRSNKSLASTKSSDKKTTRRLKPDNSDSDNEMLFSSSQASKKSLAKNEDVIFNTKSPARSSTSRQTPSPPTLEKLENISRSSSRASESSSSSNAIKRKRIQRPESSEDEDILPSSLVRNSNRPPKTSLRAPSRTALPSGLESEPETSLSKQIAEPASTKSTTSVKSSSSLSSSESRARKSLKFRFPTTKNASSTIPPIVDDQPPNDEAVIAKKVEQTPSSGSDSENEISGEKKSTEIDDEDKLSGKSTKSTASVKSSSSLSSPGSRARKSLEFGSPTTKNAPSTIQTIVDDQPPNDEAVITKKVQETPTSGSDSENEIPEEEKSTDIEDEDKLSVKSRRSTHSSRSSSKSSRKSGKTEMSSSNRYPALKNSTVVSGGAEFVGTPLSMSPIGPGEQGAPLLVLTTPKARTPKSFESGKVTDTNVNSPTPNTVQKTPHPSTPAPFARKRTRSTTQSPMFLNVMKSSVKKAIGNVAQGPDRVISATPTSSRVAKRTEDQQRLTSDTSPVSITKNVSSSKGLSVSNPGKGKSLVVPSFGNTPESSGNEWEDGDEQEQVKPRCIDIAFEEILKDRSKDFVPLEQRLMADPVFQAKVKSQRAKVAAQKAADEAKAAAIKNATKKKPRAAPTKKKEDDNITTVANNKGNLRFYASQGGMKVEKEAFDAVHGLVGEWFDFTLDQMENFCIDEGKPSLDSWEDCYKMMKRQGIVNNYMEYSGLCHELLLNDECAQLLPTSFPPEYQEQRRLAKRQKK